MLLPFTSVLSSAVVLVIATLAMTGCRKAESETRSVSAGMAASLDEVQELRSIEPDDSTVEDVIVELSRHIRRWFSQEDLVYLRARTASRGFHGRIQVSGPRLQSDSYLASAWRDENEVEDELSEQIFELGFLRLSPDQFEEHLDCEYLQGPMLRFPSASLAVSRPGFSRDRRSAVVCVWCNGASDSHEVAVVLDTHDGGTWVVSREVPLYQGIRCSFGP